MILSYHEVQGGRRTAGKVQEGRSLAEQEVPADIEDSKVKSR
jgi:hypothetical protein